MFKVTFDGFTVGVYPTLLAARIGQKLAYRLFPGLKFWVYYEGAA